MFYQAQYLSYTSLSKRSFLLGSMLTLTHEAIVYHCFTAVTRPVLSSIWASGEKEIRLKVLS